MFVNGDFNYFHEWLNLLRVQKGGVRSMKV